MKNLKKQDKAVTEFDEGLWISMMECMAVYAKNDVRVEFKNGMTI